MNENNPSDVKLDENPDGTVSFATDVVATIAGLAVTEVEGVASMVSPSSGLADMFARKSSRNLTKGVRIDLDGNMVSVDVSIVVEYGSPVPEVARGIQENVKKAIETMTGLSVHSVDIHVTGISFEREQRAVKELDEQQKKMLEQADSAADREVTSAAKSEEEAKPEEAEQSAQTVEPDGEQADDPQDAPDDDLDDLDDETEDLDEEVDLDSDEDFADEAEAPADEEPVTKDDEE